MRWFRHASMVFALGVGLPFGHSSAREAAPTEGTRVFDMPSPRVQQALAHLFEEVHPLSDGSLAIASHAYRATFSKQDGVRFAPRMAGASPDALRWQYRVRSLDTGSSSVPLHPVAPIVSPLGDHIVDFVRSGIIERYEGERDGIEQIFVLAERPSGAGDVRIRGQVVFAGGRRHREGGLEFGADDASLTYRKPVAFDAARRPLPVRAELDGERLDLVLEGAALQGAQFPVTIDPLLGATTTYEHGDLNGLGEFVDVAYNWDRGEFLLVFDAPDPADVGHKHIRGRRFFEHGDPIGPSYAISDKGLSICPRVAYDLHTNSYMVLWNDVEYDEIQGRRLVSDGTPVGGELTFGRGQWPRIVARNFREHGNGQTSFFATWLHWQEPESLIGVTLDESGTVLGETQVNGRAIGEKVVPDVAYDPRLDRFLVVWHSGAELRGRTFAPDMSASAEIVMASTLLPEGDISVAFDASANRYLAVYTDAGGFTGRLLSSEVVPKVVTAVGGLDSPWEFWSHKVSTWPGGFVLTHWKDIQGGSWVLNTRIRGDGTVIDTWIVDEPNGGRVGAAAGFHGFLFNAHSGYDPGMPQFVTRVASWSRWTAHYVHGGSGDYDGDGLSDLVLYRDANMFLVRAKSGTVLVPFPLPGGVPALLDWDGDGKAELSAWQPSTGTWRIQVKPTGEIEAYVLGRGGDIPVPGDYTGDGRDDLAVFRPSTGSWHIRGERGSSVVVPFGVVGDIPVPADWNGDGDIELGVWRPSTGRWYAAEMDGTAVAVQASAFGLAGDTPLGGNFVGSAKADQVLYRRSNGTFYIRNGASGATSTKAHHYGLPMPLDWDGDGKLDLVVTQPDDGTWFIYSASTMTGVSSFGSTGDIPAGAR